MVLVLIPKLLVERWVRIFAVLVRVLHISLVSLLSILSNFLDLMFEEGDRVICVSCAWFNDNIEDMYFLFDGEW